MLDDTPAPLGDVTRRWTRLEDDHRDLHAARLLGHDCPGNPIAHVETPKVDDGVCYRRLVLAAIDGDPVALGWIATTHRPLLVSHGRALFERDPSEWGAVCLEQLHRIMVKADLSDSRWLRRRIARQLVHRVGGIVADYLGRCHREDPVEPVQLSAHQAAAEAAVEVSDEELAEELGRLLVQFDLPTRDALIALADREPLYEVADRHGLSYGALRQRVTRARKQLRSELATYRRAAA
jgi:DNA-directed RNA polymerase specialized sigma24 family protein